MKKKHWITLASVVLVVILLCGTAFMTRGASADDPMVTLSYLNGNFKTQLMTAVEQYGETSANALTNSLRGHVSAFTSKLSAPTIPNAASTAYRTVELEAGKSYTVPVNAQILMISGAAETDAAGISDTTAGKAVGKGGALQENHLYICTAECRITAAADAVFLIK